MDKQDELAVRAIRGDEQAILAVIERDEDILYRTAYAFLKNEHDALDAMQEVTYKALRHMKKVKEPQHLRTWLMRVVINVCKDLLKKRPQTSELLDEPAIVEHTYTDVHNMLLALPSSERQLLYLKYFQQYKNEEIAEMTNLPEGTVKSKIHYILKKLRKTAGERSDWL